MTAADNTYRPVYCRVFSDTPILILKESLRRAKYLKVLTPLLHKPICQTLRGVKIHDLDVDDVFVQESLI